MSLKIGIVAVGYNRLNSIRRLLSVLEKCDYKNDEIRLIISLDNSGDNSLPEFAKSYEWSFGPKTVKTFPERLGLRNHILTCGSYMEEFGLDAIAVFEDDVIPSRAFYNYAKQAVEYYKDNKDIAGISFYKHLWNVNAGVPFEPYDNSKYDTYFMQFAQSWGQVWMRNQWNDFAKWYHNNLDFTESASVPENISNWPATSWLKYHIRYCIENSKYFVYPYKSLSTCCCDVGEHVAIKNSTHQVPLENNTERDYVFSDLDDKSIRYDAFFESVNLKEYYLKQGKNVCININCTKKANFENADYVLMCDSLENADNYEKKESYSLDMRPVEDNIYLPLIGEDICLYNIKDRDFPRIKNPINQNIRHWTYFYRKIPGHKAVINLLKYKINFIIKSK